MRINFYHITLLFFIAISCTNEKTIQYKTPKGSEFCIFESKGLGNLAPPSSLIENYNSFFNKDIEIHYFKKGNLKLKSFITLPKRNTKNYYITFSNDTITNNECLKISIFDSHEESELLYHDYRVLENEKIANTKIFYIPQQNYGLDSVIVLNKDPKKSIIFYFLKLNIERQDKDSIILANSLPSAFKLSN